MKSDPERHPEAAAAHREAPAAHREALDARDASERRPPPLGLVDGAAGSWTVVPAELDALRAVAADPSQPIIDRIEAYEDVIDSEVGDTDLTRARNVEREIGLRQIYLKFEGGNPTGTQKDRIAFAQARDAVRRGFDTITVATCGNYGAAMALAASLAGLRCLIFIPASYQARRAEEMAAGGAQIERVPGNYEDAVVASRERAATEELYDANPGGENTAIQLRAYGSIAHEIYDELRDAPAAVAVPVSNGTTLAGIYRGFMSLYRRGKTSRIPRMVAGSTYKQNPIVAAFLSGADTCEDLDPASIRETNVNEPLINWHSIDGDLALAALRSSGGWAGYASDRSLKTAARLVREHQGLSALPASAAGLHVLTERHVKERLPGDRYVAILTGRRP
jgi:threonine synthase